MAADRKLAADARKAAGTDRKAATEMRKILNDHFERGRARGRAEVQNENTSVDPRGVLLNAGADALDMHQARLSGIPNSNRAATAFGEAAAILRDAAQLGEQMPPAEEEDKPSDKSKD